MSGDYYSDAEVNELCDGLTQDAAKIRYLRRLGLKVDRKPNGRPLAWRPQGTAGGEGQNRAAADAASVVVGLQAWAAGRKACNGQSSKGR
ncbi:MAG: hypothetical protein H0W40_09025 [Methylibium sp.]|uniref:hypothetical protein n=1 Tax=Methylibium sp. TaxID=2067992 RepID=UPI00179C558C|nr:hypothetical protein [Methylibium sp.]MBA3597508.1 hypothetical protein [Methylibium sp.]